MSSAILKSFATRASVPSVIATPAGEGEGSDDEGESEGSDDEGESEGCDDEIAEEDDRDPSSASVFRTGRGNSCRWDPSIPPTASSSLEPDTGSRLAT